MAAVVGAVYQTSRDLWLERRGPHLWARQAYTGEEIRLTEEEGKALLRRTEPGPLSGRSERLVEVGLLVEPQRPRKESRRWRLALEGMTGFLAERLECRRFQLRSKLGGPRERIEACREQAMRLLDAQNLSLALDREARQDLSLLFNNLLSFLELEVGAPTGFAFHPEFLAASAERPGLVDDYCQLPCMPETTQRRVRHAMATVPKGRCLVLGDDDLVGLCWGWFGDRPCHVMELDPRLVRFLEPRLRPAVTLGTRDLRDGLPPEARQNYELVMLDPMYERTGWECFLRCAVEALAPTTTARIVLSTRRDIVQEEVPLGRRLAEIGLEVESLERDFSRYPLPRSAGPRALRKEGLQRCGLPREFLRRFLDIPYYYSETYVLKARLSG